MYCLWIGGKKVYNLEQLKDNFDLDSVEVYYYGGGLARWLRLCGEAEIADRVEKIDISFNISEQLAEIFGQPKPMKKERSGAAAALAAPKSSEKSATSFTSEALNLENTSFSASIGNSSFSPELSSFTSSFEMSSFGSSSFNQALYTGSGAAFNTSFSFETTSFSLETASFLLTSFNLVSTSFTTSSFHEYEYEFETGSSFNLGSFNAYTGSFNAYSGSFAGTVGSFNTASFSADSLLPEKQEGGSFDSENAYNETEAPQLSPKEKVIQNISACPLNRFGYGIHLI